MILRLMPKCKKVQFKKYDIIPWAVCPQWLHILGTHLINANAYSDITVKQKMNNNFVTYLDSIGLIV